MTWATLQNSKGAINRAGDVLAAHIDGPEPDEALLILNNWRSSHSFPLNTMQMGLRRRARVIYGSALIAQRLKRIPSIVQKLRRFPGMQLARMQDIGGCRAVLRTIAEARRVRTEFLKSDIRHELVRHDDYVQEPKADGYRGIHLVYRYNSDRSTAYNGLNIEVQLRSRLQHAWATAVETVGTFLDTPLKSNVGPEPWRRFFSLMGAAFAQNEKSPSVPGTPADSADLAAEIGELSNSLRVADTLSAFGEALQVTAGDVGVDARYYLLALDPTGNASLSITAYERHEQQVAADDYLAAEQRFAGIPGAQAVLVAADSLEALRRAYPNYFLDSAVFVSALNDFLVAKRTNTS